MDNFHRKKVFLPPFFGGYSFPSAPFSAHSSRLIGDFISVDGPPHFLPTSTHSSFLGAPLSLV